MIDLNILEREGDLVGAIRVAREYEHEKDVLQDRIRDLEDVIEGKKQPIWRTLSTAVNIWRVFSKISHPLLSDHDGYRHTPCLRNT